jgi:hypothetical protein
MIVLLDSRHRVGQNAAHSANMQSQLNFEDSSGEDGHQKWLTGRRLTAANLAKRLNLPLGHQVEVCLTGNVVLKGVLRLQEDYLFIDEITRKSLQLKVGNVTFRQSEIESCIRLD